MKDNLKTILALFDKNEIEAGVAALREFCAIEDGDEAIIDAASREWCCDGLVVDHDAVISRPPGKGPGVAWVSAWVCVDLPNNQPAAPAKESK